MVIKSTDPKSYVPTNIVPDNPARKFMKKEEAIEDDRRLKERSARKEQAGIAFDVEEAEKTKTKKASKKK